MIRVLVVDDEPLTAEAHAGYLARVPGFELAGIAHSAGAAHQAIAAASESAPGAGIDLVLLDLTLPDASGIDLARRLRAEGSSVDIVAVTAVRELEAVQTLMSLGAIQYLIKPFDFAAFRDRLEQAARHRERLEAVRGAATQQEVDELLASLHAPARTALPKGLSSETLDAVAARLRTAATAVTASELAGALALSRVTARRYLEHLSDLGLARRAPRYGGPGRPELTYRWRTGER
ncbi:response regulator [Homoserinibacter sp. YIM 151385]|uniref:response regulator n=1 Tax=Homoserinibacter sp. YIM 151385 TaxID=2985506 RepID=UPI0022F12D00|nr:response regulator [Homoserinibacter sp. YIM 151385]WBU38922.1 response regulator [Homoserinibacter sp. YIM 151385]